MAALGEMSTGTGNTALHQNASVNPKRYVRNVTEALKELMKLGLLERATLPSSATSAYAHRLARYQLTDDGAAWVATLGASRSDGYAQLTERLLRIHPQFEGFLKTVGAMASDQHREAFLIPLIRWGDVAEPRTQERYIAALAKWAAEGVSSGHCGWIAAEDEIAAYITGYVKDITERAAGRERPDPFARNQAFVTACEEAMVEVRFRPGRYAHRLHLHGNPPPMDTHAGARQLLLPRSRPASAPAVADRDCGVSRRSARCPAQSRPSLARCGPESSAWCI